MTGNRNKITQMQLKEKIKELRYSRKYTMIEIAQILSIGEKTVYRYMKKIEQEFDAEFKPKVLSDYRRENTEAHQNAIKKFWMQYDAESNPRSKASILNMIEKARAGFIIDMQNLHVIPKPKEVIENNIKSELIEKLKVYEHAESDKA